MAATAEFGYVLLEMIICPPHQRLHPLAHERMSVGTMTFAAVKI
jgi:hypothetical protein